MYEIKMKRNLTLFALAYFYLFGNIALAYSQYDVELIKVIDGDTIKFKVHIWPGLTAQTNVRLLGVNTPEKYRSSACEKKLALKATAFTQQWLLQSKQLYIFDVKKGKYAGRMLARVSNGVESLSQALLNKGFAVTYLGGKRDPWC